jgi:hypothetical protein
MHQNGENAVLSILPISLQSDFYQFLEGSREQSNNGECPRLHGQILSEAELDIRETKPTNTGVC